jgi:EmrB/QacA subfamily drug resistance transporter
MRQQTVATAIDGGRKTSSKIVEHMDRQHRVRWLALLVLGLATLVTVVDSSVVNVATPAMQEEFGATSSQVGLIVTIYSLVYASFVLLFGKVGHRIGLRRLMSLGAGLFGLTSLLIGLAPSIGLVNGLRAVAGVAAAMGGATGIALVHTIFKGTDRALAFGFWGATASLGAALGPVLGGWAVTYHSWRLAFFVNVPVCLFIVVGCYLWINEVRHKSTSSTDYAGAAIVGLGLFSLTLGLTYAPDWGWWVAEGDANLLGISPVPWLLGLGTILILVAFPRWVRHRESHGREPIFDFRLFETHSFRGGLLASLARQIAQFAPGYALSIFLEETAGWDADEAGLVFLASAIGAVIAGPVSGWLANRWGTKPVVIAGKALMAAAVLWILAVIGVDIAPMQLYGPLFLFGLSIGLAAAQLNTVVMSDVPHNRAGDASAAKSTVGGMGNSFGAALVGILIALSINSVLIMVLLFIATALAVAFTLPNVKKAGGERAHGK